MDEEEDDLCSDFGFATCQVSDLKQFVLAPCASVSSLV